MKLSRFSPLAVLFLFGCSATPAPDFPSSSWRPLNVLPESSTAIALNKPYIYQVLQLDTTVKGLLERWAQESNMPLVYDHAYDFTLYKNVKAIKQASLQNALQELSEFYSDKDMVFYIENGVIMAHKKMGVAIRAKTKAAKNK